jgi:putative tricarboxylic transport membrane protein
MKGELIQGLIWLLTGFVIVYLSSDYDRGSFAEPGPGALPFGLGIIFIGLSMILLIRCCRSKGREYEKPLPFGSRYRKVLLIILFMALDTFLFHPVGYLGAVFLLITVPMFLIEAKRWGSILLLGVISSFASYVLFDMWLGIPLPKGFFPF